MSKGSRPRPSQVSAQQFRDEYERIFPRGILTPREHSFRCLRLRYPFVECDCQVESSLAVEALNDLLEPPDNAE